MKSDLPRLAGTSDPRAARRLAGQIAAELLLFFVPVLSAGFALFLLNVFFREAVRRMDDLPRWLLLLFVMGAAMAASSYILGKIAGRLLPPFEYTFYTAGVFSFLVFLMVFVHCTQSGILFLYSVGISLLAGLGIFVAVGLPLIGAKATGRRKQRLTGGKAAPPRA